jgi:YVTN family beta-propeller protein
VSVFDVVNVRLDREIAVGENPFAVAVSPTRSEVYVVNAGTAGRDGSISVINAENNTVAGTIALHRHPVSIEIDPKGDLAYVADSGSNTISVVDLKARREIAAIGAGEEPVATRISPDGKTLVVANRRAGSVSLIDPAARQVREVFEGCPGASDAVILPDSSKAFVACSGGHQIMAIALARGTAHPANDPALKSESLSTQPDRLEALLDVGQAPLQLALKPDGGELFTLNSLSNSVSEVVTTTDDVGGDYMIGDDPVRGLVSADNSLLYVANLKSQYVTVYSIEDGKRIGSVEVGDGPAALAFSGSGLLLFVVDTRSGDVAVVRTASRSLFTLLPAGRAPNAIAVKAFRLP